MKPEKIILHWTAGTYKPNSTDFEHYHFLVDEKGNVHSGKFTPEDNFNCKDGKYCQHTGGGNTKTIGVAMTAMAGFTNIKKAGEYPITKLQLEACLSFTAKLCIKYNIKPENVLTHYEFGLKNPKTTSRGKIDIIYLPPYPLVSASMVGDFLRQKIEWYKESLNG